MLVITKVLQSLAQAPGRLRESARLTIAAVNGATDPTKPLRDLYTALNIEPPKKILALDPAPATH